MNHIFRCIGCSAYFLSSKCKNCGGECVSPKPIKFHPSDKYGSYRRAAKKEIFIKGGLL